MSRERERRIVISAAAGIGLRIVQTLAAILTVPVILHTLKPAGFGVWGAVTSLSWLAAFVDFGVGNALITLVARSLARRDDDPAHSDLAAALSVACILGLVLAAAGAGLVLAMVPGALAEPYLIAVAGLALNIPLSTANNVWWGLQKGHIAAVWDTLQTVCMVVFTFIVAHASGGVVAFTLVVFGSVVLSNAGSLCHVLLAHPELRPRRWHLSVAAFRRILANGSLYFVISVTAGVAYLLDNVLALSLLGARDSAQMAVALRICISLVAILWTMVQPLWPAFTEAAARGDRAWIQRSFLRGLALVVGCAVAGTSVMVAFGAPVLRVWLHADLGVDRNMLLCMAFWIVVLGPLRVPALLLNAISLLRYQAVILSLAAATAICLKFVLAPGCRVEGILLATPAIWLILVYPAFALRLLRWYRSEWRAA